MENLDLKCAEKGRELSAIKVDGKDVDEHVFTVALGVLEEQGPYACFLYLKAREGQAGKQIVRQSSSFLNEALKTSTQANDDLAFIQGLANDLDQLLFARDLLRHMFVYARYHAKARATTGERG